jgi:hypothetical protein
MPFVVERFAFAGRAEWLARAGAGPDFAVVGPIGEPERIGPDTDSGEEMTLGVSGEVIGPNMFNWSFINESIGD